MNGVYVHLAMCARLAGSCISASLIEFPIGWTAAWPENPDMHLYQFAYPRTHSLPGLSAAGANVGISTRRTWKEAEGWGHSTCCSTAGFGICLNYNRRLSSESAKSNLLRWCSHQSARAFQTWQTLKPHSEFHPPTSVMLVRYPVWSFARKL